MAFGAGADPRGLALPPTPHRSPPLPACTSPLLSPCPPPFRAPFRPGWESRPAGRRSSRLPPPPGSVVVGHRAPSQASRLAAVAAEPPPLRPAGRTPRADWPLQEPISMSDGRGGGQAGASLGKLFPSSWCSLADLHPPAPKSRMRCASSPMHVCQNPKNEKAQQRVDRGRKHLTSSSF